MIRLEFINKQSESHLWVTTYALYNTLFYSTYNNKFVAPRISGMKEGLFFSFPQDRRTLMESLLFPVIRRTIYSSRISLGTIDIGDKVQVNIGCPESAPESEAH